MYVCQLIMDSQILAVLIIYLESMRHLVECKCQPSQCKAETTYHCISDENDQIWNICLRSKLIPRGHCPYYNTYQGNLDIKRCDSAIPEDCPDDNIDSHDGRKYKGCINLEKHDATTENTKNIPDTEEKSVINEFLSTEERFQTKAINASEIIAENIQDVLTQQTFDGNASVIIVVCGILIIVVISTAIIVTYKRHFKRFRKKYKTKNRSANMSSTIPNDVELALTPEAQIHQIRPDGIHTEESSEQRNEELQV